MPDIRAGLLGRLPSGDGNGLQAIVLFDADRIVEKTDDGNHEVRARLRRIEVVRDEGDAAALQRLLMREYERRTGATTLPIELENDVKAAFEGLDIGAVAEQERDGTQDTGDGAENA